jgi:hypothetical protein
MFKQSNINIILITAIITGLKALLGRFDRELTKREKEKEYISTRDQGDPNYYFSVFTPCFICKCNTGLNTQITQSR